MGINIGRLPVSRREKGLGRIYFTIILMQNTKGQEQLGKLKVLELSTNVFHNLGIKRWIEDQRVFTTPEIYFQICKAIFPYLSIQLYRIQHLPNSNNPEKIQQLIYMISKVVETDLSHIEGKEIAAGNSVHIIHLLELLEALSVHMILNESASVRSAEENDKKSCQSQPHRDSFYTVIGINQEFVQKGQHFFNEPNKNKLPQKIIKQKQKEKEIQHQSSSSSSNFPIKPIKKPSIQKKSQKKHSKAKISVASSINNQVSPYGYQSPVEPENLNLMNIVKQMNREKQQLEKRKGDAYSKVKEEAHRSRKMIKQAEVKLNDESRQRKSLIRHNMQNRSEILSSLEGEENLKNAFGNLVNQEKKLKRGIIKRASERQQWQNQQLLDFKDINILFNKAFQSLH